MNCQEFWLETLIKYTKNCLLQTANTSFHQNLNIFTIVAIALTIIILPFSPAKSLVFFVVAISSVVGMYALTSRPKSIEHYDPLCNPRSLLGNENRFCSDLRSLDVTPQNLAVPSKNKMYMGPMNPKLAVPPKIAPPIYDHSSWKNSNVSQLSTVNKGTPQYFGQSGFFVPQIDTKVPVLPPRVTSIQNYRQSPSVCASSFSITPNANVFTSYIDPDVSIQNFHIEPLNANIGISHQEQFQPTTSIQNNVVNKSTYITGSHAPSAMTSLEQRKTLIHPNDEERDDYWSMDSSNVYDPRHTGYGGNNRHYVDPMTGCIKYQYDDINAHRMPNYITRSNVDHLKYANQVGPITDNKYHPHLRDIVNDQFLNKTIEHRNEIKERVMRKSNANAWQQKYMPITHNQQYFSGCL